MSIRGMVGGATLISVTVMSAACTMGEDSSASPPIGVSVDTIGDTVVVRTNGPGAWGGTRGLVPTLRIGSLDGPASTVFGDVGSLAADPDGNVYVLDAQAAEIRVFDPAGTHVRTIGRRGNGPGEIGRPTAIAVSRGGRVAARDRPNGRLQVWLPDGADAGKRTLEWPVVSPMGDAMVPLWIDDQGTSWVRTLGPRDPESGRSARVVVRVDSMGQVIDTLPDPAAHAADNLARSRGGSAVIPYMPRGAWAVHPDGSLILTTPDGLGIDVVSPDGGVLRILRDTEPVEVSQQERTEVQALTEATMQGFLSGWEWEGPDVPETKAHVVNVFTSWDGRIWVHAAQPSVRVPNPEFGSGPRVSGSGNQRGPQRGTPVAPPEMIWVEPTVFEVFERDGTFLGSVQLDAELDQRPYPVFFGDGGWGVTTDALGVQRVVHFEVRVTPG